MKEYFKDFRGWLALAIIIATICILGFTRFLTRKLNLAVIILLAVSVIVVLIFNSQKKDQSQ